MALHRDKRKMFTHRRENDGESSSASRYKKVNGYTVALCRPNEVKSAKEIAGGWYPQFRVKRRILPKPQSDLAQQVIKDPTTLIS